jgi:hypothetical protein
MRRAITVAKRHIIIAFVQSQDFISDPTFGWSRSKSGLVLPNVEVENSKIIARVNENGLQPELVSL